MAQGVKRLVDSLNFTSRSSLAAGESQLLQALLPLSRAHVLLHQHTWLHLACDSQVTQTCLHRQECDRGLVLPGFPRLFMASACETPELPFFSPHLYLCLFPHFHPHSRPHLHLHLQPHLQYHPTPTPILIPILIFIPSPILISVLNSSITPSSPPIPTPS